MGMSSKQFKIILREFLAVMTDILHFIKDDKKEEAAKKTEELISRINEALQD